MKRTLSIVLRVIIAAAGIAYIASKLTWTDQVLIPAGATVAGHVLEHEQSVSILSPGDFDPDHLNASLTLADPNGPWGQVLAGPLLDPAGQVLPLPLPPENLGTGASDVRLKPGIRTTLRHANLWLLLAGWLLVAPLYPIQAYRWLLLMRSRGLEVTFGRAFKLVMVGSFFNYCMPGSTGGDVAKAYYAARNSSRRADAVMSVIFDRIAGLLGLVLLAGIAGLTMLHDPVARQVTLWIGITATIVTLLSGIYFSRRLRATLGLDWLLAKLPDGGLLAKIDQAAVSYRDHKLSVLGAILLSLPVHICLAVSGALAAFALGMVMSWDQLGLLLTVVPVLFLAGSVPLTFQGLGVMEGLGLAMIAHPPLATPNHVVGMLLIIRLYQIVYSMFGSLALLGGDVHMHPPQLPSEAVTPAADQAQTV